MAKFRVLITGGSRGIGKELVREYLARPAHIVVAGVRSPNGASTESLKDLPRNDDSELIVVKIDSFSTIDASAASHKCLRGL